MKFSNISIPTICAFTLLIIPGLLNSPAFSAEEKETILFELTQTGCQFIEPEGKDHQFKTTDARECKTINKKSGDARLNEVTPMNLKPGKHTFRVTNKNVSYPLGFWLRGVGFGRLTLPSISGGGLSAGDSKDYEIVLKPGKYLYSCPLNPTPDYPIIVE